MTADLEIELMYRGHQCPSCFYMAEAVEEVLPLFGGRVTLKKIRFLTSREDACRLYHLSVALYGEEAVKKQGRVAPIPSLFMNSELAFDHIPPRQELIDAIGRFLLRQTTALTKESYQ